MHAVLASARPQALAPSTITTTLYDVIEAMQDDTNTPDEALIVAAVMDLLHSGKITFLRRKNILDALADQDL